MSVQVVVGPRERRIQSHYNQSQQGINNGSETKTADSRSLMNNQLEEDGNSNIPTDVRDKSDMQSMQSPDCTKQHDSLNEQLPSKMNATSVKKNSNKLNNSLLTPSEQVNLKNPLQTEANSVGYSGLVPQYKEPLNFTNIL